MKFLHTIAAFFIAATFSQLNAQISSFEEIEFEIDSTKAPYKPVSKKYVYLKSKKSSGGMPQNNDANAILALPITDIVLVFTETSAEDLAEREEANRARWENLLESYPEFFQYNSTFKNICQCNSAGDQEGFKARQGFYIYYEGNGPAPVEPVVSNPEPVKQAEPVKQPEPVKQAEPAQSTVNVKAEAPAVTETKKEQPVVTNKTPEKKEEPVVEERTVEPVVTEEPEKEEPVVRKPAKVAKAAAGSKRPGYEKPRRAKDNKACRQTCYGYGDEDLVAYFKNAIVLTKKQKKKGKNINVQVRIQLNYDGSVKKAFVQSDNEVLNQQVQAAIDQMGYWNPAVKGGVTIKSEIRFSLKYDKPSKTLRPSDFIINPRLGAKCPCAQDSELFGD